MRTTTLDRILFVSLVWGVTRLSAMAFEPPDEIHRLQAIGPTNRLPEPMRRAFDPAKDFVPVPKPGPHDWLAAHRENGQTFEQFTNSRPNRPDSTRTKICLLPLGEFADDHNPSLESLKQYASAFFAIPVDVQPAVPLASEAITSRINSFTHKRQLLTTDLLALLKRRLPADAFCLLGITMTDLYPEPSWNFVFGQASLHDRVGVYSFARYDPAFQGGRRGAGYEKLLLRRSCRVLVHETAHMFGLAHCIYFHCVMNGSNHLEESDRRPTHLCPVCLRKLQHSIGFDPAARYRRLAGFYRKVGFDDEAGWAETRLLRISAR